jgi:hypothetical protein
MKHGGGECFFNNNNNNNKVVDSGILTRCKETESCIKDSNSSLGGICVDVDEAYADISVERQLAGEESHASLTPTMFEPPTPPRMLEAIQCTFRNGTAGTKCDGGFACSVNADFTKIGCGSCIGVESCYGNSIKSSVGEESCIGDFACVYGKSDRAHYVCIQMKMTRTNVYLIQVEIQVDLLGTILAMAKMLAQRLLVSCAKLYNYNMYFVQNYYSLMLCKICSFSTSSSNRE